MSKKFEQLLDYLVNEEMDKANELFHEIVVEKSREIYENMIAEEAEEESVDEADNADDADESVEEADEDVEEDESIEEGFGADDDAPADDETSMSIGGDGDASDDFSADVAAPDDDNQAAGGDMSAGEEQIIDILTQLKQEFQDIVQSHGSEGEPAEPTFGDDDSAPADDDSQDDDEDKPDAESMGQPMREYVETVGNDWHKNSMKSPGPVGSGRGDKAGQATETNTKSPGLQNPKGRPTTTASAKNIAQGGTGVGEMSGTSPNADKGSRGLVGSTKGEFTKGVEKNLSSSSKSSFGNGSSLNKVPQGNKTGEGAPVGSGSGDKAGQTGGNTNTRSPVDRKF